MCGIAGIFAHGAASPPVEAEELLRIREAMAPRGPDGAGLWLSADRRVGLAHRRLAIIDLSDRGAQPMSSDDGALTITFNGGVEPGISPGRHRRWPACGRTCRRWPGPGAGLGLEPKADKAMQQARDRIRE